jgi:hypothetical protein
MFTTGFPHKIKTIAMQVAANDCTAVQFFALAPSPFWHPMGIG